MEAEVSLQASMLTVAVAGDLSVAGFITSQQFAV
jgi:hypothetical protein